MSRGWSPGHGGRLDAADRTVCRYIVKPFSSTELMARVQAALRARARSKTFVHGELAIDFG